MPDTPAQLDAALEAFQAELVALTQHYIAQLPGRLAEIQSLLEAVCSAVESSQASSQISALHHAVHGMAGSAGTFGLIEVGNAARQLEREVGRLGRGEVALQDCTSALDQLFQGLLAECARSGVALS